MKLIVLLMLPLLCCAEDKQLYPKCGEIADISNAMQRKVADLQKKYESNENYQPSYDESAANEILESRGNCFATGTLGCSWYCSGGPDSIHASSCLPTSKTGLSYGADKIHDFTLDNAWAVNGPKNSKGEYLEFFFANNSPRVTTVSIFSGYQKSDLLFKENSRPKQLRLYVNNIPNGVLNLKDSRAVQDFSIGEQGHRADGKPLVLRFEVLDVYKGSKYSDLCISEINFDGLDVH